MNKIVPLPMFFDLLFVVFTSPEEIEKALVNGAGECNGKKCMNCGNKCYNKTWIKSNVKVIAEIVRGMKKA